MPPDSWLRRSGPKSRSNEMCDFTDFVTFSNVRNDTCFVNQTFCTGNQGPRAQIRDNIHVKNDICFVKQTF